MRAPLKLHASDVRGLAQLVTDGVIGVTDLTEALHAVITRPLNFSGAPPERDRTGGITGIVYHSIRGVNRTVAGSLNLLLTQLERVLSEPPSSPQREAVLAALNGVLGDRLVARSNPLAIPMSVRRKGHAIPLVCENLVTAFQPPPAKVVMMVHGLCMNDLQWSCFDEIDTNDRAPEHGYAPVYLHYNTGLHTSVNGRAFADFLEDLIEAWPAELHDIAIVAHSMGGLVARSAFSYGRAAGHEWPSLLRKLIFLGTPHHGAPLERGGNWIDHLLGFTPFSAPFSRLGKVRSAGITDLRHGNLFDGDWQGRDRFEGGPDRRRHEPLPVGVECYTAAATISADPDDMKSRTIGDGLVPVNSALGQHAAPERCLYFPGDHQWVAYETSHLGMLTRPEVRSWVTSCLLS